MFNKIILLGHLTKGIELRYTNGGSAIGNSAIAVTRKYTLNGEKREETCFIDITFFGKTAEIANQYLQKGSKLLIEGRLKFEQWQDNYGNNRSKHKVDVENLEMLGDPQNQNGGSYNQGGYGNQNSGYGQQNQTARTQQRKTPPPQQQDEYYEADDGKYDNDDTIPF
ncbi:single-stranded DNA-binding protein [Campylobacter californiensis]|uniref:single-stranded DNA-binding protein n=1 Tax=Campylobacter californiensis TaxID=1032243 RepID=UPI0014749932|nr:single-stranded DNA-binding protein [Campylobacter sp. RM12916]MBE3610524.1 single-stranded DNA-binding protein [Campylobacter sp. RM12916]